MKYSHDLKLIEFNIDLFCLSKPVAFSSYRLDQITVFTKILSEHLDVRIYRSFHTIVIVSPDPFKQCITGNDDSLVIEEIYQQIKFLVCEMNVIAVDRYFV